MQRSLLRNKEMVGHSNDLINMHEIHDVLYNCQRCRNLLQEQDYCVVDLIDQTNENDDKLDASSKTLNSMKWFGFLTNWWNTLTNFVTRRTEKPETYYNPPTQSIGNSIDRLDEMQQVTTVLSQETDYITVLIDNQTSNLNTLHHRLQYNEHNIRRNNKLLDEV